MKNNPCAIELILYTKFCKQITMLVETYIILYKMSIFCTYLSKIRESQKNIVWLILITKLAFFFSVFS